MAKSTKTQEATQDIPDVTPAGQQQMERASDAVTAEVMRSQSFDDETLRGIASFDDALKLAAKKHGDVEDVADVLGSGFAVLGKDRKGILVGVPCVFLDWSFYDGDFGSKFVAAHVVTRNPDGGIGKYILNDGSTGVLEALASYTHRTGKTGGLFARGGLSPSEYTYCDECKRALGRGESDENHKSDHSKAVTYYIDTSK